MRSGLIVSVLCLLLISSQAFSVENFLIKAFDTLRSKLEDINLKNSFGVLEIVDALVLQGFSLFEHQFEGHFLHKDTPEGTESIVVMPEGGLFSKPEHVEKVYDSWIESVKNPEKFRLKPEHVTQCKPSVKAGAFKFFPKLIGTLKAEGESISYEAPCFHENKVTLHYVDKSTVQLIQTTKKRQGVCGDGYFFSTFANFHIQAHYREGTHKVTFANLSPDEMNTIRESGLYIFHECDSVLKFYPDIFKTLMLFMGGWGDNPNKWFVGSHVTKFQERQNIKFIKDAMGYEYQKRPRKAQKTVYNIPEELVQDGDFFIVLRLDGLNMITQYGSGTHAGHSVVALRIDGELYIVESNNAGYWPKKGIQRNKFSEWMKYAHDADYHVTWLPLKKEYAQQFNATRAANWFKTMEGMPYGFHNFLFGWIDTTNASFPTVLSPEFLPAVLSIFEKIMPAEAYAIFGAAMNMRLGTKGLTIPELAVVAAERGTTFPELMAQVEQDGWMYEDGYSYVCSAFVTGIWKAGGLYDGYDINAVEFTPRDVYETTFIDPKPVLPKECASLDPKNPFCQVMGTYRMEFPTVSTVSPYSHMNDHCPSEPPLYQRTPGC